MEGSEPASDVRSQPPINVNEGATAVDSNPDEQPSAEPKAPKRSKFRLKKKGATMTEVAEKVRDRPSQGPAPQAVRLSTDGLPSKVPVQNGKQRPPPSDVSEPDIVLFLHRNGRSSCPAAMQKEKRFGPETRAAELGKKRGGSGRDSTFPLPLPPRVRRWICREQKIEGREIRNILILGGSFQLMFTAYFAIQNLQSSLHEEEALGASALGCMYGISIVSSLLAPTVIGLIGAKGCLVVAWICYMLYTLSQFHPTWGTMVPASVLLGVFVGPLWTAQGLYVSACGYSFSKRSPHSPYVILSRFNGLFFALYETTQIVGNLVSSLVLQDGVGNKSEAIVFKFCGPDDCPGTENVTDIEEPDSWVMNTLLAIYMAIQVLGLVLTVAMVTPLPKSDWVAKVSIRDTATSWVTTLIGTEMLFLVPFMIFQSLQQGVLLSEYTKAYISCPIGIHMVGFVMATYGAVTATFVLIFSRLARLTGRLPLFLLAAIINLAVLIVLFTWTPNNAQETIIFLIPLLWGISEGIWQTQTNSMIAVIFANRKEPAFAIYQACRAVGYTLTFSYHGHLCVSTKIATALAFLVLGFLLYLGVEVRIRYRERIRGHHSQATKEQEVSSLPGRAGDTSGGQKKGGQHVTRQGSVSGGQPNGQQKGECSVSADQPKSQGTGDSVTNLSAVLGDSDQYRVSLSADGAVLSRTDSERQNSDLDRVPSAGSRQRESVSMYARSRSLERSTSKPGKESETSARVTSRCQSVQEIYVLEEADVKMAWKANYGRAYKEHKRKDEVYVY